MAFILKYWKWIIAGALILLVLFWVNSRFAMTSKLWNMVYGEIQSDQRAIEEDLCKEINRLSDEREAILKKLTVLQADKTKLQKEVVDLENDKVSLQAKLDSVNVPTAPSAIVDSFRSLGLGSARARNLP